MIISVDLEIKKLLSEFGNTEQVARSLIDDFNNSLSETTAKQIEDLCRFLFLSGHHSLLIPFCLSLLDNHEDNIPWALLFESIGITQSPFDEEFTEFLLELIQTNNLSAAASLARTLQVIDPRLTELRQEISRQKFSQYKQEKIQLLERLEFLKTQQLHNDEKYLIERLAKLYPGDDAVLTVINQYYRRSSLESLEKNKISKVPLIKEPPEDIQVSKWGLAIADAFAQAALDHPEMAYEFAVACFMIDEFDMSLEIIERSTSMEQSAWLRLECLLRAKRFVELLAILPVVELKFAHNPDVFFSTAYFRAQAYWGLGERHLAIEVMQSLAAAKPDYRSASALLSYWETT